MITVTLRNGESKSFNLKSFEREKALRDAWWAMHDDPSYEGRRFKVATSDGDALDIRVADIESVEHSDAEYYHIDPDQVYSDSHPMPRRDRPPQPEPGRVDPRADIFLDALSKRGVTPDYADPFLHRILRNVAKTTSRVKIGMYANMYANHAKAKGAPT